MHLRALAAVGVVGLAISVAPAASAATALPGVPTGVTTSSGNRALAINWKAPTTGGKVAGYQVADRRKKTSKTWTSWTYKSYGATARRAVIGATNGSTHQIKVRARSAGGYGKYSGTSTVKVGLPSLPASIVVVNGLKTNAKKIGVSWRPASGNGSAVTGYLVYLRKKGATAYGAWTTKAVSASTNSAYFKGLSTTGVYQAAVRSKNKYGYGPLSAAKAPSYAKVAITTPGPYHGGQNVTVKVSGFTYDQSLISVGVCANDGRVLAGPNDCATIASNGLKFPVTLAYGAATATVHLPNGALGNTTAPALTCGAAHPTACAMVADVVGSEFFESAPTVINWAPFAMTISPAGPYVNGDTVTINYSGFNGGDNVVASTCIGGIVLSGPNDCAPFGPGNTSVLDAADANGSGSVQIKVVAGTLGAASQPTYACSNLTSGACVFSLTDFSGNGPTAKKVKYTPTMTISPAAPYTNGQDITITYSGFKENTQLVAATCVGGVPLTGPDLCAAFGPANQSVIGTADANGAGTIHINAVAGLLGSTHPGTETHQCSNAVGEECVFSLTDFAGFGPPAIPVVYGP